MAHIRIMLIICLIGIFLLSGCSVFKTGSFQDISWQKRQQELRKIEKWHFKGAFSITYDGNRDIARFDWVQSGKDYSINIIAPLNMGSARIVGNSQRVKMQHSEGQLEYAATPEKLISKCFGWRLPISNIKYWILSLPAPGKINAIKFDEYGHLRYLEQAGWKVSYYNFFVDKDGIDLPKSIEVENGSLKIKIKILASL